MHKHPVITEQRIQKALDRLKSLIHSPKAELKIEAYHVHGEPISVQQALEQTFEPFRLGGEWGPMWDTTWFRFSGSIPEEWKGREVVALVRLDFKAGEGFTTEGQVWQNGVPTRAINVNRMDVPLATKAAGGEAFEFHVEAAANPNRILGGLMHADPHGKPLFVLDQAELTCFNRAAYQLYMDMRVLHSTMSALPENEPRRAQIRYALNEAVNIFDERDPATIPAAGKPLQKLLSRKNGDTVHQISAIGHAHIDTAWLWPLRETIRKCARTFSTALRYMDEYPEYRFCCSQPHQYAWMKELYPTIYSDIKAAIKRGQWEPLGSMWIEADCNLSSGESLIRQILHGKNFFMDEFGVETRDVWLPDVFGYSAALPQIMKKSGIDYFLTQKISWSQLNKFPHHTFLWEGIDGTRIFTHFPPADTYNASMTPKELIESMHNFREHDRATRSLYVYGYGDGGGGPSKDQLEMALRMKDLEGVPKVAMEKAIEFFEKAEADAKDLPLWVGELYLELHRGTYTTQAKNKRHNRKCEFLLRDAEFFHSMVLALEDGADETHAQKLDQAWKLVLLNQFHDIIPGSSINWVYQDSERDYEQVRQLGTSVLQDSLRELAALVDTSRYQQPIIVFNTLSHTRSEVLTLPDGSHRLVDVPACGYRVIEAVGGEQPAGTAEVKVTESSGNIILDNGLIRLTIDKDGLISSIFDLRAQREVMPEGAKGNLFQLHKDYPNAWDAWDVDIFYRETAEDLVAAAGVQAGLRDPLRATVKIKRSFGKSAIEQTIILNAGSARIDFVTDVDWHENNRFLKVAFPVEVRSPRATYEIQFGHVERPTHFNTSWDLARFEVCAQKWADLSESGYGVALLNDCKYGHDIVDNVIRLSLLRAPGSPDPAADRGKHQFTYSLLPHLGDFREGKVIQQAYNLNVPVRIVATDPHPGQLIESEPIIEVDRPGVVIETIKRAEKEDAIIIRFYEAYGSRGPVTLTCRLPIKSAHTADLMERTQSRLEMDGQQIRLTVTPFEIVTLKLYPEAVQRT